MCKACAAAGLEKCVVKDLRTSRRYWGGTLQASVSVDGPWERSEFH